MSTRYILRFPATRPAFAQAFGEVRTVFDECGLGGRVRSKAELVFEEVVANVIRHGCTDGRPHHLDVSVAREAHGLVLTFDDDGLPFNPLERAMPTLPMSLEEATLGGLGLLLVRKASTGLAYERTPDHKNRLTVTIANL